MWNQYSQTLYKRIFQQKKNVRSSYEEDLFKSMMTSIDGENFFNARKRTETRLTTNERRIDEMSRNFHSKECYPCDENKLIVKPSPLAQLRSVCSLADSLAAKSLHEPFLIYYSACSTTTNALTTAFTLIQCTSVYYELVVRFNFFYNVVR